MDIIRVIITGAILAALLAFCFRTELSRFEINRLAEHNSKYKTLARFMEIYPGIFILTRILALFFAIFLTVFAALSWGLIGGSIIAFFSISAAYLIGKMLHEIASDLISKNLAFFNKYFKWAKALDRIQIVGDGPKINSEEELSHLISSVDFLEEKTKTLLGNVVSFEKATTADVMTLRKNIITVSSKDELTPKLIDDLYNSTHKVFPVTQGKAEEIIGMLYLDDILPITQNEKPITEVMRKTPPAIEFNDPLETALHYMSDYHFSVLLVAKNSETVGIVTLSDVLKKLLPPRA
ncbi:MAG: CBS domain-containing protein [Candidatus Nomurabacteria bacterium]|jgi:CBS domain containing-hemolysin-like protein|nr:CBS domain-containing protein [Candidatus Nomurabacteria bacterium]